MNTSPKNVALFVTLSILLMKYIEASAVINSCTKIAMIRWLSLSMLKIRKSIH